MKAIPGKPGLFHRTRSKFSWISYYRNGRRFRESSGQTDVTKANRVLLRRKGEIESGNFVEPAARRVRVDELIANLLLWYRNERHKARYAEHSDSKWRQHLEPFFGGMKAEQVTTDILRTYRAKRAQDNPRPSPSTVNRELAILRKAFKLAASASPPKIHIVPVFPIANESGNARKVFIPEADKQKLRDAAAWDKAKSTARMKGLHLKVFVELLFAYGWRKGELANLKVKNVDLMRGVLRIETSKTDEGREVALTESLKALLQAAVIGRELREPLFPVKDMRWAWRRLCKEPGVPCGKLEGVVMHDARRTTARAKRSAGVSESVINASMGWKPGSKMLARYGIVSTADTLDAQQAQERWELANARTQRSEDGHTLDTPRITNSATSSVTH